MDTRLARTSASATRSSRTLLRRTRPRQAARRLARGPAGPRRQGRAAASRSPRPRENIGLVADGELLAGEDAWPASRAVDVVDDEGKTVGSVVAASRSTTRSPTGSPARRAPRDRRPRDRRRRRDARRLGDGSSPARPSRPTEGRSTEQDGEDYRYLSTPLLDGTGVRLAALSSEAPIAAAVDDTRGGRSSPPSPSSGSRFSSPGRSPGSSGAGPPARAAEEEADQRRRARDVRRSADERRIREAVALVGEALAATTTPRRCCPSSSRARSRRPARPGRGPRQRRHGGRPRRAPGGGRRAAVAPARGRRGRDRPTLPLPAARRILRRGVRAARPLARRAGLDRNRERAPAPHRQAPGDHRRADPARQPAPLHGDARRGGPARRAVQRPSRARPRGPRRLQAHQRPATGTRPATRCCAASPTSCARTSATSTCRCATAARSSRSSPGDGPRRGRAAGAAASVRAAEPARRRDRQRQAAGDRELRRRIVPVGAKRGGAPLRGGRRALPCQGGGQEPRGVRVRREAASTRRCLPCRASAVRGGSRRSPTPTPAPSCRQQGCAGLGSSPSRPRASSRWPRPAVFLLRDDGPEELAPDLDQAVPSELKIVEEGDTYRLVFASAVDNVGPGPLVIEGERRDGRRPR